MSKQDAAGNSIYEYKMTKMGADLDRLATQGWRVVPGTIHTARSGQDVWYKVLVERLAE